MTRRKQQHEAGWKCPECKLKREVDGGPDPCLGALPGVLFACCGHGGKGNNKDGYVYFTNGRVIRFSKLTSIGLVLDDDLRDALDLRSNLTGHPEV